MADVEENLNLAKQLLYKKYNKKKYEFFTSNIENLLILENMLMKSNRLLNTASSKSKNIEG